MAHSPGNARALALLLVAAPLWGGCDGGNLGTGDAGCEGEPGIGIGDCAPEFEVQVSEEDSFSLQAQRGSVVVVDISVMSCVSCRALGKGLEELYARYGDRGLMPICVLMEALNGSAPTLQDSRIWADALDLSYPIAPGQPEDLWPDLDPFQAVPTTYVIDQSGAVVFRDEGVGLDDGGLAAIEDAIAALLPG